MLNIGIKFFYDVIGEKAKVGCQYVYPNSHSLFCNEMQNFTVLLKRPFVILQWNTKFWSCTQTVIRFLPVKYKILKLFPNSHFAFYNDTQNFENCYQTNIRFLQRNIKFWKLRLNGHLYFPQGNWNLTIYHQFFSSFVS